MPTTSPPHGPVRSSLTAIALAVALLLAACSSGEPDGSETATDAAGAATPTEASAPTEAATPTEAPTTAAPDTDPTESGDGGLDAETTAFFERVAAAVAAQDGYRMAGNFDDPTTGTASMRGAVDQRGETRNSQLTVEMEGQPTMRVRIIDGTTYVTGIPGIAAGGTWLSVGPDDTVPLMGQMLDSIQNMASATPDLEQVPEGTTVEALGTDQVDGESYDHYRLTDADGRVQEAWLDGDLPRRIMDADGGTIDYTDWGAAIDIEAPNPDNVRSIADIMGEMGGGGLPDGLPTDLPSDLLDGIPDELLSELPGG